MSAPWDNTPWDFKNGFKDSLGNDVVGVDSSGRLIASDSVINLLMLAPEMAEAIVQWGRGNLDTSAPLLKECYFALSEIVLNSPELKVGSE